MKRPIAFLAVVFTLLALSASAYAHCEMPCGIYDDDMRIKQMAEDIATIEKSMDQINQIQSQSPVNYNQLVRWIDNKEHHAQALQETVSQYFMTQRLAPVDPAQSYEHDRYLKKLETLQLMLYYAMKCKQTTDLENVRALKSLLQDFDRLYFNRDVTQEQKAPAEEEKPTNIFEELQRRLGK